MIIDSHCHLDYPDLYNKLDDVIKRAEYNQVQRLLTICTTTQYLLRTKQAFRGPSRFRCGSKHSSCSSFSKWPKPPRIHLRAALELKIWQ